MFVTAKISSLLGNLILNPIPCYLIQTPPSSQTTINLSHPYNASAQRRQVSSVQYLPLLPGCGYNQLDLSKCFPWRVCAAKRARFTIGPRHLGSVGWKNPAHRLSKQKILPAVIKTQVCQCCTFFPSVQSMKFLLLLSILLSYAYFALWGTHAQFCKQTYLI